jgi:cation transport ATPase
LQLIANWFIYWWVWNNLLINLLLKWGWQLIAINCNKLFRVGYRDMYRLTVIVTVATLFISNYEMTTKDKCDYKLMKECFFEILAN